MDLHGTCVVLAVSDGWSEYELVLTCCAEDLFGLPPTGSDGEESVLPGLASSFNEVSLFSWSTTTQDLEQKLN